MSVNRSFCFWYVSVDVFRTQGISICKTKGTMIFDERFADELTRRISSPSASACRERGILLLPWFKHPHHPAGVRPDIVRYVCDNLPTDAFVPPCAHLCGQQLQESTTGNWAKRSYGFSRQPLGLVLSLGSPRAPLASSEAPGWIRQSPRLHFKTPRLDLTAP